MKRICLLISIALLSNFHALRAQDSCYTAVQFCTGNVYEYTMNTGLAAPVGPDYGCLSSQASPLWVSIYVTSPGNLSITGAGVDLADNPVDIDYIYWGPFSSLSSVCYSQLDAGHILGCDYSTNNLIDFELVGATAGSYYIAMVSNYSGVPSVTSFSQTAGAGVATCTTPCVFSSLTATPSACNVVDNTYSLSGTMSFSNPPTTGTLTVFGSCGGSQTFTAPFASPIAYNFNGLISDGNTCFVSALFSDGATCSINQTYTAPIVCNPFISVKEILNPLNLIVSPNPSNGIFDIDFKSSVSDAIFSITDISGRVIETNQIMNNSGSFHQTLNLTKYSKGMYFLKVSSDKMISIQKIIYN